MEKLQQTLNERGEQYGDFRDMAFCAQTLKAMLIADDMNSVQKEAMDLICTKLARISHGNPNNRDSWHDIAGYAQLVTLDMDREDGV